MTTATLGPLTPWAHLRPTTVQIAFGGDWRAAIDLTDERMPRRRLRQALDTGGRHEVAAEVFFADPGARYGTGPAPHGELFLGVRLDGPAYAQAPAFLHALAHAVRTRAWGTLADAVAHWRLPDGTALLPEPDDRATTLEVGVVNAWHDIGAAVVWRDGEPTPQPDTLTPALRAPQPAPVAVEIAYATRPPTWLGFDVSTRDARGRHVLVEALLAGVCATFIPPDDRHERQP
ncbi:hypothetical protein [Embleya sp. MST-111070]|uniref:hypothetical protein n=1 Tax=Embleya sp. MST-111070 TaxID=3398231 RepID=UPI003F738570